jgi:hypothetical protein
MEYAIWVDGYCAFKCCINLYSSLAYDYNLVKTDSYMELNELTTSVQSGYLNRLIICKGRFIYFENETNFTILHTTGDHTIIAPAQTYVIDESIFCGKLSDRTSDQLEKLLVDDTPLNDELANFLIIGFDKYLKSYQSITDSMKDSMIIGIPNKSARN